MNGTDGGCREVAFGKVESLQRELLDALDDVYSRTRDVRDFLIGQAPPNPPTADGPGGRICEGFAGDEITRATKAIECVRGICRNLDAILAEFPAKVTEAPTLAKRG